MKSHFCLLPSLLFAGIASASCGLTFCTVNTGWDTQGLSHDSGWLLDMRYSYARANEWRSGTSRRALEAPSGSGEEIENKRTTNQVLNINLDYAIDRRWGISLGLPFVFREHAHSLDSSVSGPVKQTADFDALGDVRFLARYQFVLDGTDSGAGLRFGLKLPTGQIDMKMSPRDPSDPGTPYALERSSQPGTGSTDAIIGAHYFQNAADRSFGWFAHGQLQSAMATRNHYRPGREVTLDLGMHYEIADAVNLLIQLNALSHARDKGSSANPASGGRTLNLSPGLSYALDTQTQLYAFIQKPLYLYANADRHDPASGQLVSRWSATLGMSQRF